MLLFYLLMIILLLYSNIFLNTKTNNTSGNIFYQIESNGPDVFELLTRKRGDEQMATTYYDKLNFGMAVMNTSQIGSGYDGSNHYSHASFEIDFWGMDSGVDKWTNFMKHTKMKIVAMYPKSTGNTAFFWPVDDSGNPKMVYCADGTLRYITLALTHSNYNWYVGQTFGYGEMMYTEGTQGHATGNHIHAELCFGKVKYKVVNIKGGYNLPNMVAMNRYMYVLSNKTTIKSTKGLSWKTTTDVTYKVTTGGTTTTSKKYKEVTSPRYHIGDYNDRGLKTKVALNMRKANSTKSDKILTIPADKAIKYYGFYDLAQESGYFWLWVQYDGKTGFAYGKSAWISGYNE